MIFSSRRKREGDPHILWKVRLFFLGAALALLGIGFESSLLIGLAIGALFLGAALRFLPVKGEGSTPEAEDGGTPGGEKVDREGDLEERKG